jgi:hypothetical protein
MKIVKLLLVTLSCLLVVTSGYSQTIGRSVISSYGNSISKNGIHLQQTIGQPTLISYNRVNDNISIRQGLQQPLKFNISVVQPEITLYPKPNNGNFSFQIECVTIETDGYVTIKIWDTKKGAKYKPEQARKDAIYAILFSGISAGNGCSTQPPILNKTEELENFKTIEKSFFAKKGKWSMFTRSSETASTLPANLGENNWKVYQVSISKNELRKYLENQKIIKSLTNAF